MNKYTGKKSIESFFEFLMNNTDIRVSAMSDKRIVTIKEAFPDKILPDCYIAFLKYAGDFFELWSGSDYVLVNSDNRFIDLSLYVQNDEKLDRLFQKSGFMYENCMFFFGHQGNTYAFFQLNDGDNPTVYILDQNVECERPIKTTMAEFLIDTYNSHVSSLELLENPWRKCRSVMAERVIQDVSRNFFKPDNSGVLLPFGFDEYVLNPSVSHKSDFMKILNPILVSCISHTNSVYVYSNSVVYLYFPNKNHDCSNTIGFDLYEDNNYIIDREYKWGWIVRQGHVFVFGDDFRKLVHQNISCLIELLIE